MDQSGGPGSGSDSGDESDPLGLRQYIIGWSNDSPRAPSGPPEQADDPWQSESPEPVAYPPPPSPPAHPSTSRSQQRPFQNQPPHRHQRHQQTKRYRASDSPKPPPPVPGGLREPPYNLEAERSVLGAILVQNEAIDRVLETGIEHQDFYLDTHGKIFQAALQLYERREPVDLVTLTAIMKNRDTYDYVGGSKTLTRLFDEAFAVGNVVYYAKIVRDKAILRKVIDECSEIIGNAYGGVEDTEAFLDEAESRIFSIGNANVEGQVTDLRSVLMDNMTTIEELALKKSDITGLETGFTDFDRLTTGLRGGQVMVLAARPGMGKTSWFISALQHAAVSSEAVVAMFSLEMAKDEIGFRFLSGLSRIDSRKLKIGRLSDRDWQALAEAADRLSKSKIFIDDTGGVSVMDLRAKSRRLLATQGRLDLIVIDYLQLMKGSKSARGEYSREREISEISRNLKELAKELKVPIIAVSQLNRGVETRQDKRPTLSDLRESGAIEQDADLVCFIHRDDYYDKESENKGIAEFIVAKNRAGETNTVRLGWLGQYTLFTNLASDEPGTPANPPQFDKGDVGF